MRTPKSDRTTVVLCLVAAGLGVVAGPIAAGLIALIHLVTNLAYYGSASTADRAPGANQLGWFALVVPVVGGLIVGLMARFGSPMIRGHGIPEAMEQVLTNESKIAPKLILLKPISAAISIGTGGPFGAEGPIIATGGALGSVVAQFMHLTAGQRKTLLAAGAAAGMAATFGCPIAALLLAVELLLFEWRLRSLAPVGIAAAVAGMMRTIFFGPTPIFAMSPIATQPLTIWAPYVAIALLIGILSVGVTKIVYGVEDAFDKLPVHWAWWPAIGGLAVGLIGMYSPKTLGVGYANIRESVTASSVGIAVSIFAVAKFVSWSIALGSGTSGGTLAPLFTIGGSLGSALVGLAGFFGIAGLDSRIGALVGMSTLFAGASRAVLASTVFALETTGAWSQSSLVLACCLAGGLASRLLMKTSIMTEKIERRGIRVPTHYSSSPLERYAVKDVPSDPIPFTDEAGGPEESKHETPDQRMFAIRRWSDGAIGLCYLAPSSRQRTSAAHGSEGMVTDWNVPCLHQESPLSLAVEMLLESAAPGVLVVDSLLDPQKVRFLSREALVGTIRTHANEETEASRPFAPFRR